MHVDQVGVSAVPALRAAGVATPVSLDGGVAVEGQSLAEIELFAPTEPALLDRRPGSSLEDALRAALDEGPSIVVATRGSAGSVGLERRADGSVRRHEAPPFALDVHAGSTLGAGDVFHGALLAGLVEQRTLDEALVRANACAALACRGLDGRSAIPTREALDAFVATADGAANAASGGSAAASTSRSTADVRP
jgi:sulfofructose kinase